MNDAVLLRDANGKELRFARHEIDLLAPEQKSIMPELLLRDFTAGQVADLLAFLEAQ